MPASEETLGSDWLGRSFWRIAFKTSRLSNITKISFAFKSESSLNLTPTLYFELRFPIFITNGYDRKANACSPWTSCCFCVKRIMLWDCLCFYSSCFSASIIRNIGEFSAKNYFTDHRTANTMLIQYNRGSVPVLKIHDCY